MRPESASGARSGRVSVPKVDIDGCRRSHQVLLERLTGLTEGQARGPSLLPDWSVAHVLTHIARNADSVVRRLEAAVRGMIVDQYPGGRAGRAAEIAAGAGRSPSALVDDVAESATHLEAVCLSIPEAAWERPVRDVGGAERPARTMMLSRWREVEVHHADLGLGYRPVDWPRALIEAWLPRELERLLQRTDPSLLLAWVIGRADAPTLPAW